MPADVRLYRSACAWCLPVLLVGLPSWPLAVLSALAWWLLGKMTTLSSPTPRRMRLLPEASAMLQYQIFTANWRPASARLSAEVSMRLVMITLSAAMLAGNLLDGVWLGGDDMTWFWVRFGLEAALGLVGGVISMHVGQLRQQRGKEQGASEATEEAVAIIRAAVSRPARLHGHASAPATD